MNRGLSCQLGPGSCEAVLCLKLIWKPLLFDRDDAVLDAIDVRQQRSVNRFVIRIVWKDVTFEQISGKPSVFVNPSDYSTQPRSQFVLGVGQQMR